MAEIVLSALIEVMLHWKPLENTYVALVQKIIIVTLSLKLKPQEVGQGFA